jgi:nucleoid-associated protein YgaU
MVLIGDLAQAGTVAPGVRLPISIGHGPAEASVVVQPGDHLWKISTEHLSHLLGRDPADAEIHPYWREVIVENVPELRSGDADLIYPGEVVRLPNLLATGSP